VSSVFRPAQVHVKTRVTVPNPECRCTPSLCPSPLIFEIRYILDVILQLGGSMYRHLAQLTGNIYLKMADIVSEPVLVDTADVGTL
jgi:hypothetical protein